MGEQNATFQPNVGSKDKSVGWYDQTFHGIEPAARALLEEYSHITPEEVDQYVIAMRDKAWDIFPYPCIGQFRFLNLSLSKKPSYERILERLRGGATYLDIGCCIGQDIRKLVHDGAPGGNLHGAELQGGFIGLGYDFFRDRDTLGATLVQADVFDLGDGSSLSGMVGKADILHLGMVLHLFGWDKQRELLENCVKLLRPASPGPLILGQAVGDVEGGVRPGGHIFCHNVETFNKMWSEISERSGLKFECRATLDEGLGIAESRRGWDGVTRRRLSFEVERVG
ncbi:methyltransferase domain-containing protein [Diaporthe eres]|nr:methyltransferase domain-containing protein [Diaporthe eres]